MAQRRDEVRTDLTNRTECLKGKEKKIIIAGDLLLFIIIINNINIMREHVTQNNSHAMHIWMS